VLPAQPAAAEPALEPQALARLGELDPDGSAGLVRRVLSTYLASLQRLAEQARQVHAAHDMPGLRYVAHTLKSSSSSVGAGHLAALCMALEQLAASQPAPNAAEVDSLVMQLLDESARVAQAVRPMVEVA
jgi:HPt (histidine-containing phosphotransfer) domain-containing protein